MPSQPGHPWGGVGAGVLQGQGGAAEPSREVGGVPGRPTPRRPRAWEAWQGQVPLYPRVGKPPSDARSRGPCGFRRMGGVPPSTEARGGWCLFPRVPPISHGEVLLPPGPAETVTLSGGGGGGALTDLDPGQAWWSLWGREGTEPEPLKGRSSSYRRQDPPGQPRSRGLSSAPPLPLRQRTDQTRGQACPVPPQPEAASCVTEACVRAECCPLARTGHWLARLCCDPRGSPPPPKSRNSPADSSRGQGALDLCTRVQDPTSGDRTPGPRPHSHLPPGPLWCPGSYLMRPKTRIF